MEHAPNLNSEADNTLGLSSEEIKRNEQKENVINRAQFALILDELRSDEDEKVRLVIAGIQDEEQLIQLCAEHPEIELRVAEILGSIGEPFRKMLNAHPEVLDSLMSQIGDDEHFPFHMIDLSLVKEYLPKPTETLH
jgi:hypothetical protein